MLDKITIICPEHREFQQKPQLCSRGSGCKKCGYKRPRKTSEQCIKDAIGVHGNLYDYSKTQYERCSIKSIIIICKKFNHEFSQVAQEHLAGSGCPICWEIKRSNQDIMM